MRAAHALVLALLLVLPAASALPTPGLNGALTQATLGRVFPEAFQTNDFISYEEAVAGLEILDEQAPDFVELVPLGESTGWATPTGARETSTLYAVEVTNEKSATPPEEKLTLVFFLSIHGNEKGAREGGLRVIEDLALGLGLAEEEPDLLSMLDYQKLVFIFANTDGWTREDPLHRTDQVAEGSPLQQAVPNYARENGHFYDLNRGFPTTGYFFEGYTPLSEAENQHMVNYTRTLTNVVAGADMHGMLRNTNLVRILLKDGEKDQQEIHENELLAELYKERLNANDHYALWTTLPQQPGVCCGQVAEWAATFDAIGYAASGTAGAWIVQAQGLDAPGYTVEFAYNHLTFDNYYPGVAQQLNDYHIEATRDIVSVFMRFAAETRALVLDAAGARIVVLDTDFVATDADDDKTKYAGWAVENAADDAYDNLHRGYRATSNAYWDELAASLVNGRLDRHENAASFAAALEGATTVVVPGSAAKKLDGNADALAALRAYAEAGGNLVLTDEALRLLEGMGLVPEGSVQSKEAYSGYTDLVARDDPLVKELKGFPRQTYDPNPLGYGPGTSPVWFVGREAFEKAGGKTVGAVASQGNGEAVRETPDACDEVQVPLPIRGDHDHQERPVLITLPGFPARKADPLAAFELGVDCQELDGTNLGVLPVGAGKVHVFGAILPDPSEEANHPYGLDNHAVANNGNKVLLAMLGLTPDVTTRAATETLGQASTPAPAEADVPAPSLALVLVGLVAVAMLRRR